MVVDDDCIDDNDDDDETNKKQKRKYVLAHAVDQAKAKQTLPGLGLVYSVIYAWSTPGLHIKPLIGLQVTSISSS